MSEPQSESSTRSGAEDPPKVVGITEAGKSLDVSVRDSSTSARHRHLETVCKDNERRVKLRHVTRQKATANAT